MGAVIGIFSAKGGVGKTLLATNLAVACSLGHQVRTALIDLSPGTGTADLLLDLEPQRSWADLQNVIRELTSQHLLLAVTPYRPGLDLLASPPEIIWGHPLSRTDLACLLEAFQKEYELVVVDVSSGVTDLELSALELVDQRLVLLTPDAPALQATTRYLKCISEDCTPTSLVINQQTQGAAVLPSEIKNHLGKSLIGVLPIDPQGVWGNVGYGKPCTLCKTSKLGSAIHKLSERLLKMIGLRS
ncbi:MAG: CpaE family protein [Anaerolineales bacterium]